MFAAIVHTDNAVTGASLVTTRTPAARAFVLAAALQAGGTGGEAWAAEHPTVRLDVVRAPGASGCPDGRDLASRLGARLGYDPRDLAAARSIEVLFAPAPRGWSAQIATRDERGTAGSRVLERRDASCADLVPDVVLAVALAIDPSATLLPPATPTPAPTPAPTPVLAAPTPRARRTAAHPPATARPRTRPVPERGDTAWFNLRAGATLGLLPVATTLVALGAESPRQGALRWTLGALFVPRTSVRPGTLETGLVAANVGACLEITRAVWRAAGCAHALGGVLDAAVRGEASYAQVSPAQVPWFALALSARASVQIAHALSLEAEAGPVLALWRHRFVVAGEDTPLAATGYIGVAATLGARVRFW